MAKNSVFSNGEAQEMVFDNLGLTASELGVGDDLGADDDGDDGDSIPF